MVPATKQEGNQKVVEFWVDSDDSGSIFLFAKERGAAEDSYLIVAEITQYGLELFSMDTNNHLGIPTTDEGLIVHGAEWNFKDS